MRRFQRDFEPGQLTFIPVVLVASGIAGATGRQVLDLLITFLCCVPLGFIWQWRSRRPVRDRVVAVVKVWLVLTAIAVGLAGIVALVALLGGDGFEIGSPGPMPNVAPPLGVLAGLILTERLLRHLDRRAILPSLESAA